MTVWQPLLFLEAKLKNAENRLKSEPSNVDVRFERAILLNEIGRADDARNAYVEILQGHPTHFGALNNLGALLMAAGLSKAAVIAYEEAVKQHPRNPKGHVNLADTLFKQGDVARAEQHFRAALAIDPDYRTAHQGMAYIYTEAGDEAKAKEHRHKGFEGNSTLTIPYRGDGMPIVVVLLASSIGGMIPLMHHLDSRVFMVTVVFVEFYDPVQPLPPHQIVFNAIGDADLCKTDFDLANRLLKSTDKPVINMPDAVRVTGRADNAARFAGIKGIRTPKIVKLLPATLAQDNAETVLAGHGLAFPVLLRSPGYHTGRNFVKAGNVKELHEALPRLPGRELMVIEYMDSRGADGKARKYRVMILDGKFYPMHAAVSGDWKVHYFTADMENNADNRAEDERFLNDMEGVLGASAMQALEKIRGGLALEYCGVDFAIDKNGDLQLFEANATMVVNSVAAAKIWDYRRPHVEKIFAAIRALITSRVKLEAKSDKITLPPLLDLLTRGGDSRIICDPVSGLNKYGCPTVPDPRTLAYGSATASTISYNGFIAAEQLRVKLEQAINNESQLVIYAREMERLRGELSGLLALQEVPGTDIIFSASGTDVHALAVQLMKKGDALRVVMLEASETGSGVPAALKGKTPGIEIAAVQNRTDDGTLRSREEVDVEVKTVVEDAVKSGMQVLLVITDVSKTGFISPGLGCVVALHHAFPKQVSVLVDACQFRMAPSTLHAYLKHGFMVAITGSKFITGPAFSGVLLVPKALAQQLQGKSLPPQPSSISICGDWPAHWAARNAFPDGTNYGLLLRLEAALAELKAFMALPENDVTIFLKSFALAVRERLANDRILELLPMPALDRMAITDRKSWDQVQTIFPFALRASKDLNEADILYQNLRAQGCQVGQPVLCGMRDGAPVAALRLCASMRLIADALAPEGRGTDAVIKEALSVLNKTGELLAKDKAA